MEHLLKNAAEKLGISLDSNAFPRFKTYCDRLIAVNQVMNLTAITNPSEIYLRHFADSIALLSCADFSGKRVIDVGTGAGFPGMPLKIACPSISLTLLDSLKKRIDFLADTTDKLNLSDVTCIHGRAEECAMQTDLRDSFDIAVSRAVSPLTMLCELCLPYVRPGGIFLAMKSLDYQQELSSAQNAIKTLQARVDDIYEYSIAGSDLTYCVLVIKKIANTPTKYPRRFAKIQKSSL